jgi:peptide deformylase
MTVQEITLMGNPVLMTPSRPVEDPAAPEIAALIQDMKDTMESAGGIGIAAPQIGVGLRVMMFYAPPDLDDSDDSTDPDHREALMERPLTVLINPELEILSEDRDIGWEGCLSVPGMRGVVPRHQHIRYQGITPDGRKVEQEATGFHAVVFQHEYDHLDGILYPMRMEDMSTLQYVSEMEKVALKAAEMDVAS